MHSWILLLCTMLTACAAQSEAMINSTDIPIEPIIKSTDSNKDMGHQEAVTFFKSNGSGIDLANISSPLLTNVTAQSMIGVAPATIQEGKPQLPWPALQKISSLSQQSEMKKESKEKHDEESQVQLKSTITKRALNETQHPINSKDEIPVKIEKGVAVVPDEAGVKSLTIPPVISFNNNFTDIPVPIPNTSVVHYTKVNTLVQKP